MENPVLVEVTRGPMVESVHRGMVAVFDANGASLLSLGDVEKPVYLRSAIKVMQAIPLVESGAADALKLTNRELALACSSHSGEAEHIALAEAMAKKAGMGAADFECGSHWSFEPKILIDQVRKHEKPNVFFNNCSGKHAGFLCLACYSGVDHHGYSGYDHPVQAGVRDVMQDLTGAKLSHETCGTDGCNIPTYAMSLKSTAIAFARMGSATGLSPQRGLAAKRLIDASMAEPFYVAGTGRMCTRLMQAAPGRIYAKTGAEGIYCAAIPEKGIGIALKAEDGATRAAESMMAALLAKQFADEPELAAVLSALATTQMKNWNKTHVGTVRPAGPLA